ncbi:MAG TPA: head GIN domain-containing protein [Chitinophagaceae bacterium]|jgi:hypothetical protein|nr:head GIN domain-containing protein [Chitinophagaceae bacterium]
MKKLLFAFLIFSIAVIPARAQKVINDLNAEKRVVTDFHGIDVGTGIRLTLTGGNVEEVAVSAATPEFRDKIITKVENGVLKIYYESKPNAINTNKERKELKAYVSYKTLDKLEANTGAEVEIEGTVESPFLKMNANTGARINGKINSADLEVDQNTGSVITLSGNADKLNVEGSTGSKFEGTDLVSSICNARVSTGARISVTANKELTAKANTGGNVKYKGDPSVKEIRRHTGGSVSKI